MFPGSDLPPSYDIAAKLPTYEEAERVKELHEDLVSHELMLAKLFCLNSNLWDVKVTGSILAKRSAPARIFLSSEKSNVKAALGLNQVVNFTC